MTVVIAALALFAGIVLWLSQSMVAPDRPTIATSARPMVGLALRTAPKGGLTVVRATGPAAEGGLKAGDRIVAVDETKNPDRTSFVDAVHAKDEGQKVRIEAKRRGADGTEISVLADVLVAVRKVSPAEEGLPFEDVSFRNAAGLNLRAWYIPPPNSGDGRTPAIAWGHGNAADRRQWLPFALAVHDAGLGQVLLDFTGRGESDGEVITLGAHEADDLRAALDFLAARGEIDPLRLALGGKSMGGAAAILEAADDPRVKALVVDSAFADLRSVVDRVIGGYMLPAYLVRPVLFAVAGWRAHYDPSSVRPVESIRKVRCPILILQGDADTLVPLADARALEQAAGGKVTLITMKGIDHNTPRPEDTGDKIAGFLRGTLEAR